MNRLIVGIVLSIYTLWVHATVQVQIDSSPVAMNETFQLTLTQNGTQAAGLPDLTVLRKDFLILGTARQVSYSVINGQSSMNSQWVITLKPLKAGLLSIPSIKIGSEQSNPMTINVEASANSTAATSNQNSSNLNGDLVLKTSVNLKKPYVNQGIIYTVKLYNSKRLLDAEYQAPQAADALIIPLGDAKRYQTFQNSTNYVVEEQKYAVFPQKSGSLKITSPSFTAMIYDFDPQRIKAQDKDTEIKVQPIPTQYQNKTWLPAKHVRLSEHYENTNQTLSQGSTLVRTITLEGIDVPAQLLPNLTFTGTDNFSVYPEKGADRNQVRQGELVGSTEFKVTYLFNKAGKVVLPEVKVHWFNTQTGQEETSTLAPRSVEITPALQQNSNSHPPVSPLLPAVNKPIKNTTSTGVPQALMPAAKSNYGPWIVALFFAGAWLSTLLLGTWKKRNRRLGKGQYKHALNRLKHACVSANPMEARDALIAWARVHWPDASILNLSELSQLVRDPQLKKQIHILSQALYKSPEHSNWQGHGLLKAVLAIKSSKQEPSLSRKSVLLPPINPN